MMAWKLAIVACTSDDDVAARIIDSDSGAWRAGARECLGAFVLVAEEFLEIVFVELQLRAEKMFRSIVRNAADETGKDEQAEQQADTRADAALRVDLPGSIGAPPLVNQPFQQTNDADNNEQ